MNQRDLTVATDESLLDAYQRDQCHDAFTEIVRRYHTLVLTWVRRVVNRDVDAEDACQATFFALAKSAHSISTQSALQAWLRQTAKNCAIEILRCQMRQPCSPTNRATESEAAMENSYDLRGETPFDHLVNQELREILTEELAQLPTRLQVPVKLCDLDGWSQNYAARHLGLAATTFKRSLEQGRSQLRQRLLKRGVTLAAATGGLTLVGTAHATTSPLLATQIANRAIAFAQGTLSSDIGVSADVIRIANKVLLSMTKTKAVTMLLVAVVFFATHGMLGLSHGQSGARAELIFRDDFADGNLTDGDPVRWTQAFGAGILSTSEEGLVLSTGNQPGTAFATPADRTITPGDVSIRTQVRLVDGAAIGVAVRWNEQINRSYLGFLTADQRALLMMGGSLDLLSDVPVNFDVSQEDAMIQLDVVGDQLKLWAWPAGQAMPSEPTLVTTDTLLDSGRIFLWVSEEPGVIDSAEGNFRFVELRAIPEPASAPLLVCGLAGVVGWCRTGRTRCRVA
jgi:RNA polymerase sigma factor (sigma-70 family)